MPLKYLPLKYCEVTLCSLTPLHSFCMGGGRKDKRKSFRFFANTTLGSRFWNSSRNLSLSVFLYSSCAIIPGALVLARLGSSCLCSAYGQAACVCEGPEEAVGGFMGQGKVMSFEGTPRTVVCPVFLKKKYY